MRDGLSLGDYDHCINALKQLQKRVTVNLIYDPDKKFKDPNAQLPPIQPPADRNPFESPENLLKAAIEKEKELLKKHNPDNAQS